MRVDKLCCADKRRLHDGNQATAPKYTFAANPPITSFQQQRQPPSPFATPTCRQPPPRSFFGVNYTRGRVTLMAAGFGEPRAHVLRAESAAEAQCLLYQSH